MIIQRDAVTGEWIASYRGVHFATGCVELGEALQAARWIMLEA